MTISQVPNFSDLQLVECVVRHEADAFNEIYRRHVRSVTAISKMVLGNSSACEDVVAEVFLAFWLKPDSFDASRGSLLGFLRMKARGRSIDIIRTDVARRRREVTDCLASPRAIPMTTSSNWAWPNNCTRHFPHSSRVNASPSNWLSSRV